MKHSLALRKALLIGVILFSLLSQAYTVMPDWDKNVDSDVNQESGWVPQMSPHLDVSGDSTTAEYPDTAFNSQSNEYFVVWVDGKDIMGRRVSHRGENISGAYTLYTSSSYNPSHPKVAYDSTRNRYLIIWGQENSNSTTLVKARFIPWNGPDAGLTAFDIDATKPLPTGGGNFAIAYGYTCDEFMVVWEHTPSGETYTKIAGRRVNADGAGFPAASFVVSAQSNTFLSHPDIAYNLARNEYLVVYDDYPKDNDDVWGVRLSSNGTKLSGGEFAIAGWPDEEAYPSVAACHTSDQYLVAWHSIQDVGGGDWEDGIYARFIGGDGTLGAVTNMAHYTSHENQRMIDVACGVTDDPRYLVIWTRPSFGYTYAREIWPNGTLSDTVEVSAIGGWTAAAGGNINFLATFGDVYARIIENTIPRAAFTVTPQDGPSTTTFAFDATASSDNTDDASNLQVRWDWENDGVYDTTWSYDRLAAHKYTLADWQMMATFYPKVQVTDGHGVTDTTTQQVVVRKAIPNPIGPATTIGVDKPRYQWTELSGVTAYQIQLYNGATLKYTKTVTSPYCNPSGVCMKKFWISLWDGQYKWRVRAKINGAWGDWSDFKWFKVDAIPTPYQPSGSTSTDTPKYTWSKNANASSYQIQVKTGGDEWVYKKDVWSPYCTGTTCMKRFWVHLSDGYYKWRVRARVDGVLQSWSTWMWFHVQTNSSHGFEIDTYGE